MIFSYFYLNLIFLNFLNGLGFRKVLINLIGFSLLLFSSSVQKYYCLLSQISQLALFSFSTFMQLLYYVVKFLFFSYKFLVYIGLALEGSSIGAFLHVHMSQTNLALSILTMSCLHLSAIAEEKSLPFSAAVITLTHCISQ